MDFTLVAITLLDAVFANGQSSSRCKTFPGDKEWPTKREWDAFNRTVGGHLVATVPLGAPCQGPAFDNATCENLKSQWQYEKIQYVFLVGAQE
jgi:hypothetical protein